MHNRRTQRLLLYGIRKGSRLNGKDQPQTIVVLGGARSGKSTFAERLALSIAGDAPVLYVATAEAGDADMAERIARHRAVRPAHWRTLEVPRHVAVPIRTTLTESNCPVVLLDCLTLLATNWLLVAAPEGDAHAVHAMEDALHADVDALFTATAQAGATAILVSNEVGAGIVPAYELGRVYRDVLGRLNQAVARRADSVYAMFAGIPVDVKALARTTGLDPVLWQNDSGQ